LGGNVDDYRSNLVLNMVQAGELDGVSRDAAQKDPVAWAATVTEQQLIMRIIGGGDPSAEADVLALAGQSERSCVRGSGLPG
jgi:protein JSN1